MTDRYYIANKTANTGLLTLIMRVSSIEPAPLRRIHVAIETKDWVILHRWKEIAAAFNRNINVLKIAIVHDRRSTVANFTKQSD